MILGVGLGICIIEISILTDFLAIEKQATKSAYEIAESAGRLSDKLSEIIADMEKEAAILRNQLEDCQATKK